MASHPAGWYYPLSRFFKERFGERVYKVPVHAGFTCPNRDGSISRNGCIFCYNPGFSPPAHRKNESGEELSVAEQIRFYQLKLERVKVICPPGKREKLEISPTPEHFIPQKKYLAYFQSYSNTYAPLPKLQALYEEALSLPGVIGLSIATRPDCLTPEIIRMLSSYAEKKHIWLELGLQTAHNETLSLINRGHTYEQFARAVEKTAGRGIFICAHIINGLPGENIDRMLHTVEILSSLPLQGVKFHQLQVVKNTLLEDMYCHGSVEILKVEEYLKIICDQLEILREDIVVHRLLSEVFDKTLLIAPHWEVFRGTFSQMVAQELKNRNTHQGVKSKQ